MPDTDRNRGSGRTSQQMIEAPRGAAFCWVTNSTRYAEDLARHLRRTDLRIIGPGGVENLRKSPVILDHAAFLTERQHQQSDELNAPPSALT